jgi:hypothetical protein
MGAAIGAGIVGLTAVLFWRTLPRNGKTHFLVGTQWEPYFAILFVGGAALGLGMMTVWIAETYLK